MPQIARRPRAALRGPAPSLCLSVALATLLSACATPRESCILRAEGDIRALEREISTVSTNITRGYAIFESQVPVTVRRECTREDGSSYPCDKIRTETKTEAVPLDMDAEERKLARLQERLNTARAALPERIRQCRALHPEAP